MSILVVQKNHGASTSTTITPTCSATVAGNTIVIAVLTLTTVAPTLALSGFTHLTQNNNGSNNGGTVDVWYQDNNVGGLTSFSVTGSSGAIERIWYIYELSGTGTPSFDKGEFTATGTGSGVNPTDTISGLSSTADLVIAFITSQSGTTTWTADAAADSNLSDSTVNGSGLTEEKLLSGVTSVTLGATRTNTFRWVESLVAFQPPSTDPFPEAYSIETMESSDGMLTLLQM